MTSPSQPQKAKNRRHHQKSPSDDDDDDDTTSLKKIESVTKTFLSTLSTIRGIGKPIEVHEERKSKVKTADEYEILYDPAIDKNHPFRKWSHNRFLRCLITREIARYMDRRTFITVSVREALIYCIFFLLLSIITFGSFSLEKFYLSDALTSRYTKLKFNIEKPLDDEIKTRDDFLKISFHEINTMEHIWFYQVYIMEKLLFKPFWNSPKNLYENKMIGVPRIRQIRVKNITCSNNQLNQTLTCYGPYTESNEERELIQATELQTRELSKIKKWEPASKSDTMPFSGSMATYSSGGYMATFSSKENGILLNNALKSNKWYSRATRAIFIEFTIYNGNVNLFCIFKLVFELPPTGGVVPTSKIYVKKLIRYDEDYDYFILGCEIVCMIFVIFYTIQKLLEIIALRTKLLTSFWNYIDLMVLIMSYLTFVFNLLLHIQITDKLPQLASGEFDFEYVSLDRILHMHILYGHSFAVLIGFVFLRFIKYFNVIHCMHQLQATVSRAMRDILNYFILFFYIYFTFAFVGLFLFGRELEDFKTLPMAIFTLMRYSVADFNYDALVQTDPILGPLFYFIFMFSIVFILAGIFLAILVLKYQEVRSEVSIGCAKTYLGDMLRIWLLRLLERFDCPWLLEQIEHEEYEEKSKSPTEHVRHYLRTAGYSELEIELFFKKYEITDTKIEAMEEDRISYRKGEREAPPPLTQKDMKTVYLPAACRHVSRTLLKPSLVMIYLLSYKILQSLSYMSASFCTS